MVEVKYMKLFMGEYSHASTQILNLSKNSLYFFNTLEQLQYWIAMIIIYQFASLLVFYPGIPLTMAKVNDDV